MEQSSTQRLWVQFIRTVGIACGALLPSACVASGRPLPEIAAEINATHNGDGSVLVAGDLLEIRFTRTPEWNHEARVLADGTASFVYVDAVPVAGLTLAAVDRLLTERYGALLRDPELTLFVKVPAARTVVVIGEVRQPGPVPLGDEPLSLLEAIGKAGGPLKHTAHLDSTLLVRWLPDRQETVAWKIDAGLEHWGVGTPLFLQAHDLVFVPNRGIDRVNIFVDQYIRQMLPFPGFSPTYFAAP